MKKSKKSCSHVMRIDVRLEYRVVWGDYGAEWHELSGRMSCEHSSDEAIVMAMNTVVSQWQEFMDEMADQYAHIHWDYAHWKEASEKEWTKENLCLFNQPGISEPVINSKRNCKWQKKQEH